MGGIAEASREALWISLQIGGPLLVLMLVVGLVVAVFQALTQVNEASLSFLPKMVALAVALILLTPFFTGVLRGYAQTLFEMIIQVGSRP
ncbi:MAG: flagellar type III secretion system protein FliQ [Roseomonas sp.]|jgi:flagellar biosynthetic protein FliQ|nr:flagellar type III secretion system protein FliQ [Roseomonas sp.]MCA3275087.1 flagellar type III secretion system protein FliQ [Roseomonas sp.]MCA3283564.1 flagellar type III secretion system protein FliQ [Roseomonas sp.]MCA3287771.1 flagellar type III secretion system protein FliQ [Roseomonas sp.]MCA3290694.1 flagellar type III secretion system protein FliQ [Roseomonas sp.]